MINDIAKTQPINIDKEYINLLCSKDILITIKKEDADDLKNMHGVDPIEEITKLAEKEINK